MFVINPIIDLVIELPFLDFLQMVSPKLALSIAAFKIIRDDMYQEP